MRRALFLIIKFLALFLNKLKISRYTTMLCYMQGFILVENVLNQKKKKHSSKHSR